MNPPDNIEDHLKDFIAKNLLFSSDGFPYSDDTSFLDEGIIDSLGVMDLVEFTGKRFNISIAQAEVTPENFDSIKRLSAFVRRKLSVQPMQT